MELLLGYEKVITKSGISLNAGTLNRDFTVLINVVSSTKKPRSSLMVLTEPQISQKIIIRL
jgi:hypothetical protein